MRDLLRDEERTRLVKFATLLFAGVQEKIPVRRENPPLVWPALAYVPGTPQTSGNGAKKVVILTDDDGSSPNLAAMTGRLLTAFFRPG